MSEQSEPPAHLDPSLIMRAASLAVGILMIFIILLTSVQAVCFWVPNWWRNEYAKYDTPSNVRGEMSLDDAVHVTEDMLDYCIGKLDTLDDSEATIDGVKAPFFTEREKSHLSDCRELFMKGMRARVICLLLVIGLSIYLYVHLGKRGAALALSVGYLRALSVAAAFLLIVSIASLIDFTAVFTLFHKIFFDNDLWILYPNEDNLINIMQENVFADAAIWIGGIWAAVCAMLSASSILVLKRGSEPPSV
ncbi:MAG: TIGR01906 family membrane protein [Mogibacterium sp.]|nr:TIGR01906 family membrane protein [Mogibacterium sp.]